MREDNIFDRLTRWWHGILFRRTFNKRASDAAKREMCRSAQGICSHECDSCAWQVDRSI